MKRLKFDTVFNVGIKDHKSADILIKSAIGNKITEEIVKGLEFFETKEKDPNLIGFSCEFSTLTKEESMDLISLIFELKQSKDTVNIAERLIKILGI